MKQHIKKSKRHLLLQIHELLSKTSFCILVLCLIAALLPTLLLYLLLIWKSIFFPATVPIMPILLLPFLLMSIIPAALLCAFLLSMPYIQTRCVIHILLPISTILLLLSNIYLLLLIYHVPYVFCIICAAFMVLLSFLALPRAHVFSEAAYLFFLISGIGAFLLFLISICF